MSITEWLQDLMDTQGLGHTNSKQPIQYHLRLKNELEEMRSECVGLLKERFHLEQCIRQPPHPSLPTTQPPLRFQFHADGWHPHSTSH
jgi:hypothetical protein